MPSESDLYSVPEEKAAPKVGTLPSHIDRQKNLADNEDLVAKVNEVFRRMYSKFRDQPQREALDIQMREDDQMYRLSKTRPTGKREMKTTTNVRDSGFRVRVDTVHSNEVAVLLPEEDLPAVYDIEENSIGTEFIDEEEARAVANAQQMLAKHTWEQDDLSQKIPDALWYLNKYGQVMVSCEWDRRTSRVRERAVSSRDEDGIPVRFTRKEVDRIDKDCPGLFVHDLKDVYYDTTLDQIKDSAIIKRFQPTLNEMHDQQRQGWVMNVGKLKRVHLYRGEHDSTIKIDRQLDAGEQTEIDEPNGLLDGWHGWMKLPIDPSGKGKWDAEGTLSTWFWCTFLGRMETHGQVCVRLIANPYDDGEHPYKMIYQMRDDKGAVHQSLGNVLSGLHWESQVNINQAIEGKDLMIRSPMILEGQVMSGDLTFTSPNKLIRLGFGSTLQKWDIKDSTGSTMMFDERIQDRMDKLANTRKTIQGEALGSRTSATEAKTVQDQAVKPTLQKVNYEAQQLFPWLWRKWANQWRQFGDPKREIRILGKVINPATLWGPFKVKVTVITEFANNALVRQQLAAFSANNYAAARQEMTPEGAKLYWQEVWKVMGLRHGKMIFGMPDIGDALTLAREESYQMVDDGVLIPPQQDQNHAIHKQVHESILEEAQLAVKSGEDGPRVDQLRMAIPILQQHLIETERLIEQAKQAQEQQQAQQQAQVAQPGESAGINAADQIEAEEGAMAQAAG